MKKQKKGGRRLDIPVERETKMWVISGFVSCFSMKKGFLLKKAFLFRHG
jgi:hypothetical protein